MKKRNLSSILFFLGLVFATGCGEHDDPGVKRITGKWIEKDPEKFDGISDTIVFKDDRTIGEHFLFEGREYAFADNKLTVDDGASTFTFKVTFVNRTEIIIHNFQDRSFSLVVKDIHFVSAK